MKDLFFFRAVCCVLCIIGVFFACRTEKTMGGSKTLQTQHATTLMDDQGRKTHFSTSKSAISLGSKGCAAHSSFSPHIQVFSGRGPEVGDQWSAGAPSQGQDQDTRRTVSCLIQDSDLTLGEKLGSGSFGVVKRAEWHTPTGRVVGHWARL